MLKNKSIAESFSVVLGVITVFVVQITFLASYSSYILAFFIVFSIIYITVKKRSVASSQLFSGSPVEMYGLTAVITLIVSITNGLSSPLFFFLYFLLFLIAFMGEALSVWSLLAVLILYFLPQATANLDSNTFIKLGSLLLITPIAYFVAKELERRQLLNQQISEKTEEIIHDAQVLKDGGESQEETEMIDEIIEEAQSLNNDSKN